MISSGNAKILLLSALFFACASARNQAQWRGADRRVHEENRDPEDFGIEYEGDQPNRENYFQEIYMLQSAPKQIEFGHVCENPDEWEQRYERKDFDRNRHQGKTFHPRSYRHHPEADNYEFGYRRGSDFHLKERFEKAAPVQGHFTTKVRWADKKGGHGEHYWDYNHAGRGDNPEEEKQDVGEESKSVISETESPTRQHQKRQLLPEPGGITPQATEIRRKEAEDFLRSFRREIGGVFDLEAQNRNLFSNRKSPVSQFDSNFPFFLQPSNKKA